MEILIGPILFGLAGLAFGLWVVYSDSRRMGFARPRSAFKTVTSRRSRKIWALALASAAVALGATVEGTRPLILTIAVGLLGQTTITNARRNKKVAEGRRQWPFLIESMAVATLSGMDTGAAFVAAAKRARGTFREELDKVTLRMAGGASLSRALASVDESYLPDAKRLRSILAQSEILGTPVASMLKALSDEGYESERQAMEEKFNALPLKLSAITVFFLLPPVLAVSVVPHVLAFLEASW